MTLTVPVTFRTEFCDVGIISRDEIRSRIAAIAEVLMRGDGFEVDNAPEIIDIIRI